MYASRADMAARYGADELDDLAPESGGRADAALADACAEIDAALGEAYRLPLGAGPWPALRSAACDLARANLYDDVAPKTVRKAAAMAREAVAALADGSARLLDAAGAEAPRRQRPESWGPPPGMDRASLAGFV